MERDEFELCFSFWQMRISNYISGFNSSAECIMWYNTTIIRVSRKITLWLMHDLTRPKHFRLYAMLLGEGAHSHVSKRSTRSIRKSSRRSSPRGTSSLLLGSLLGRKARRNMARRARSLDRECVRCREIRISLYSCYNVCLCRNY